MSRRWGIIDCRNDCRARCQRFEQHAASVHHPTPESESLGGGSVRRPRRPVNAATPLERTGAAKQADGRPRIGQRQSRGIAQRPVVAQADAASINQIYRYKKDALSKARADGDGETYVFLHERPYRLDAMFKAPMKHLRKNPSEFWKLVGRVWIDTEYPYQHPKKWKQLWGEPIEGRRACMSEEEICFLDTLPEQIEIWRGTSHKRGLAGLAWTLDRERAVRFAQRFCSESRVPLLAKGIVEKPDVLAYLEKRHEREIVSMKVSIISVTKLRVE